MLTIAAASPFLRRVGPIVCCVALAGVGPLSSRSSAAAGEGDSSALVAHLEFMGYTCTVSGNTILAKHEKRSDFTLKPLSGGYLLRAFYSGKSKDVSADQHRLANSLNSDAVASRFFWDGDGDMAIEAWFGGAYDKQRFGTFLDVWNTDNALLLVKFREQTLKFLK
jgi:hypothetical protein